MAGGGGGGGVDGVCGCLETWGTHARTWKRSSSSFRFAFFIVVWTEHISSRRSCTTLPLALRRSMIVRFCTAVAMSASITRENR